MTYELVQDARPEWVAKRYIIDIYFKVAGLEAVASIDPAMFPKFKAGVRQLYRIMRPKMWRCKKRLGLSEETLEEYDSYLLPRKYRKLTMEEVLEWFADVQKALELLGYTRFETATSVEALVRASREG